MLHAQQRLAERLALSVQHANELAVTARESLDQRRLHRKFRAFCAQDASDMKIVVLIKLKADFRHAGGGAVVPADNERIPQQRFEDRSSIAATPEN